MKQDLNDMMTFVAVVECGSFTAAADFLGVGKSQVSQRMARLEERLGMRLLQRTTRQQHLTDFGHAYYQSCRGVYAAAEQAQKLADNAHGAPAGDVRVACPPLFSEIVLGPVVVAFMRQFGDVRLLLSHRSREVDVVGEGFDLVFRISDHINDSSLVARSLGKDRHMLVASESLLGERPPNAPEQLRDWPTLSLAITSEHGRFQWPLTGVGGAARVVRHEPRLVSDDLFLLREAALAGLGVVALPAFMCAGSVTRRELVPVLPEWSLPGLDVHVVFPSRKGQAPAVRSFLEFALPRVARRLQELQHSLDTFIRVA